MPLILDNPHPEQASNASASKDASPPIALYIHWPFCKSKCPYCDFNSHVRASIDEARWRSALLKDLEHYAALTGRRAVTSIFFGGGTPSLMSAETVDAVLQHAASLWPLEPDVEITLEANPTSVEAARFRDFRSAGINRVSLGVQALDDRALKFLGRGHDAAEALTALEVARQTFTRFSFDLIYARPGQTVADWERELERALSLAGEHLSVYQLTIEAGTAFAPAHARGDFVLPDEETQAALYETTVARLEAAGLPAYEISNHARPGAECRHNLVYWRYGDYVGVGPGAHGRLTLDAARVATRQHRAPETWLEAVERTGHGSDEPVTLTPQEQRDELLMMGLRLAEGIRRERFRATLGLELEAALDPERVAPLVKAGFLEVDDGRLAATPAGRQRLNAVLASLLA
ncbi:MAG TPA: radical SAM family heme chaperone HemW [Solirubrobacteraceae bacterium]|nr:radical SAM family heme chaperone HemW [Solirubrobacteraceae bacterium]